MKNAKCFVIIVSGIAVLLTGYLMKKVETALEDSVWGNVVDGIMIAALFIAVMRLLQWAVWVLQ